MNLGVQRSSFIRNFRMLWYAEINLLFRSYDTIICSGEEMILRHTVRSPCCSKPIGTKFLPRTTNV
jgi:hypothetical protein